MKKRKKWPLDRGEVYTSGSIKRTPKQQKAYEEAVKKFRKTEKETTAKKFVLDGNKPAKMDWMEEFKKQEERE